MSEREEVIANALRAYGEAIRGDWSSIDGRSVRANLSEIASYITNDTPVTYAGLCDNVGVCHVNRCWPEWCDEKVDSSYKCVHMYAEED